MGLTEEFQTLRDENTELFDAIGALKARLAEAETHIVALLAHSSSGPRASERARTFLKPVGDAAKEKPGVVEIERMQRYIRDAACEHEWVDSAVPSLWLCAKCGDGKAKPAGDAAKEEGDE